MGGGPRASGSPNSDLRAAQRKKEEREQRREERRQHAEAAAAAAAAASAAAAAAADSEEEAGPPVSHKQAKQEAYRKRQVLSYYDLSCMIHRRFPARQGGRGNWENANCVQVFSSTDEGYATFCAG